MAVDKQDTHGPGVQASAARLLWLLMEAYPKVTSLNQTPSDSDVGSSSAASSSSPDMAQQAQVSLLQYLASLIPPETKAGASKGASASESTPFTEEDLEAVRQNHSISGTVQLIDSIRNLPEETLAREDKIRVFKQIKVIAQTCPGFPRWDWQQAQWSINRYYDPETGTSKKLMTSPAEAFNLVCHALFDEARLYKEPSSDAQKNLEFRIQTFYQQLLALWNEATLEEEEGEKQICSAGLQHAMLYCLNGIYLDDQGQPVHLLIDDESFLLETLALFVEKTVQRYREKGPLFEHLADKFMSQWIAWNESDSTDSEFPLNKILRTLYPNEVDWAENNWKTACKDFIEQRCRAFLINPKAYSNHLEANIENIESIPIPASESIVQTAASIRKMPEIRAPQHALERQEGPGESSSISMPQVVALRNQALQHFKDTQTAEHFRTHRQEIQTLFSALSTFDALHRYRDLITLVGAEDAAFQESREHLKALLSDYFRDYTLDTPIPPEFDSIRAQYMAQQRIFVEKTNVDVVENFFADLDNSRQNWAPLWNRLTALQGEDTEHPLVLTDQALDELRQSAQVKMPEGTSFLDLTPYAINRVLLHGLLQPMNEWTATYCDSLTMIAKWLLQPMSPEDDMCLNTFKRSGPKQLLANLNLMAAIQSSQTISQESKEIVKRACGSQDRLVFQSLLIGLFGLSPRELNEAQRTEILSALKDRLGDIIENGRQLAALFGLSPRELNEAQRTEILSALKDRLGQIIENSGQLRSLFELSSEQLSEAQRAYILNIIEDRLAHIIENDLQLRDLFTLSSEKLSQEQRTYILSTLGAGLGDIIKDGRQLRNLFELSLEKLSKEQRTQILSALEDRLGGIIESGDQLAELFKLSLENLSKGQRTLILNTLGDRLANIIQDGDQLADLFKLSPEQLSEEQRTLILSALGARLGGIIESGDQLAELFKLSLENLSKGQRTLILNALEDRLGDIIESGDQLAELFKLSLETLSKGQRTLIFNNLGDRLTNIIQNGQQLADLFKLSSDQLNEAQREQTWITVKDRMGDIIQNGLQLRRLFELSPDQLNEAQRARIWSAVEDRLGDIIQNGFQLAALFRLSPEQLNEAQRAQIWIAVKDRLGQIIENGNQLRSLFELSSEQLSEAQRAYILNIIEDRLAHIIENDLQLRGLFRLSSEQLSEAQRTQILSALENRLGDIIKDGRQLRNLFELSPEQLSKEQRTLILSTLGDRLREIIKNGDQLSGLFELFPEQLNEVQRTLVLSALKDRLGGIIKYYFQLADLFKLSSEQLSEAQRTQILSALENRLGDIIREGFKLIDLFELLPEQLSEEQRTGILSALGDRLGDIIENGYKLRILFKLLPEQLNEKQRTQILAALERQPDKIRQARAALEALPPEQFNAAHREQIKQILGKPISGSMFFDGRQEKDTGGPSNPQNPPGSPKT